MSEDLEDIYLDILPDELNLMITSFLSWESISPPKYLSYGFYKLFFKDETYRSLFRMRYLEAYDFILKTKNIDGSSSWKDLYYFFVYCEGDHPSLYFESEKDYPYIMDIYYFYYLYKDFPKFYEQVSNININHRGLTDEDNGILWKDIYIVLISMSKIHEDFIIKGIFSEAPYMAMRVTLTMYDEYERDKFVALLISYIYLMNNPERLDAHVLFDFFCTNFDMYENLCLKTKKSMLIGIETLHYPTHLINMFNKDLKKRVD